MKTFINLLLGAFLLVSFGVLVEGVRTLMVAIESKDWPSTAGTIVRSGMDVNARTESSPRRAKRWKVEYHTNIVFRYQTGEAVHSSNTVTVEFDELPTEDRAEAERLLRKYPVGRAVAVYYRPTDPGNAVTRHRFSEHCGRAHWLDSYRRDLPHHVCV